MIATFRDYCIRVGCSDHYLNKQLQHAFESEQIHVNKNVVEKVDCDIVQNMFNQIKNVVSHVRHSHQQQTLSKKLVSYSDTRFNGAFIMMNIFQELFFELPSALVNSNFMINYNLIEKDLLGCVCKFLEPFEELMVDLSEEQRPTLHKVIPLRQSLINSCAIKADDCNGVIELKVFLGKKNFKLNSSRTCILNAFKFYSERSNLLWILIYIILARRLNNAWLITDEHR